MNPTQYLKASDGTGNASVATIQSVRAVNATTLIVDTTQGMPDKFFASMGTPHTFTDPVTGEEITTISEATAVDFAGHIDGNNIEIDDIAPGYTDNGSAIGDIIVIRPTTSWADAVAGATEDMEQFIEEQGDWRLLAVPTVTAQNGQKETVLTFTGVDYTDRIQAGTKLKVDRTGTVPTQCADFEASSSQYASKSSPTGITFADDFTVEAWVKLESYSSGGTILSRRNAADTDGWYLEVSSSGQIVLGVEAGTNYEFVRTYQSIPTNRWVHVAAHLDLSSSTGAVYINGSVVPTEYPFSVITSLGQAGDLQIAAAMSGTFLDSGVHDVRLWSGIRTATQIKDNYLNYPTDTTGLIGWWKLDGNFNDSSSNANNLTAFGGVTATTLDNPKHATEYVKVTKSEYTGGNTLVTVFGGTDHGIPSEVVAAPHYSGLGAPIGFPASNGKWITEVIYNLASVGTTGTTYVQDQGRQLSISSGQWNLKFIGSLERNFPGGGTAFGALSTSTSSVSHEALRVQTYFGNAGHLIMPFSVEAKNIELSSSTTFYAIVKSDSGGGTTTLRGDFNCLHLIAELAY